MSLEKLFSEAVEELSADVPHPSFVLAVSGGIDSMVLLTLAARLSPRPRLLVAHYHHGIRANADDDLRLVQAASNQLGLPFYYQRRLRGRADEDSLRRDRYEFLENLRVTHSVNFILTAHHADDQLETLLMRLIRGTGLAGLRGILPRRDSILRPLLKIPKSELIQYAVKRNVCFREDETNGSQQYFRNRVRHRLTPPFLELAQCFGGSLRLSDRLNALLEEIRENEAAVRSLARDLLSQNSTLTPFWIRLDVSAFLGWPVFWQEQVLREALSVLKTDVLSRKALQDLRASILAGTARAHYPGVSLRQSCGQLYLQTPSQKERESLPLVVQKRGAQVFIPALEMTLRLKKPSSTRVRFFQPGDRLGKTKLKELFLTHRVPQPERRLVPLLVDKSHQVIWVFPQTSNTVVVEHAAFPFASKDLSNSPSL